MQMRRCKRLSVMILLPSLISASETWRQNHDTRRHAAILSEELHLGCVEKSRLLLPERAWVEFI